MQRMLRWARIAAIDTAMAVVGEWAPEEEQAESVQRELEGVAAPTRTSLEKQHNLRRVPQVPHALARAQGP
jgi:hypothetical protein